MYSPQIDDQLILDRIESLKGQISSLLKGHELLERGRDIPAGTDLLTIALKEQALLRLVEGNVAYKDGETTLFFYEPGELIGLQSLLKVDQGRHSVVGELRVTVDVIAFKSLEKDWNKAMSLAAIEAALFSTFAKGILRKEVEFSPDMKFFSAGSDIITEGGSGDEVYTLVEGEAEALIGETKVGDILKDEIFGMLAAITSGSRTATVRAKTDCMVMAVPADKFIQLVETRPQLVIKLLQDLARTVSDLNKRVAGKY